MSLYKLINAMKQFLFTIIIISFSLLQVKAQVPGRQGNQNATDTSRIERAKKKYQQLFAQEIIESKTDPELMNILQRFIFGEVFFIG